MQITASTQKNPCQVIASAIVKNVEAMTVAVTRFGKRATLTALARMLVQKTSDTTIQAPGPILRLKNARYEANPSTVKNMLAVVSPVMVKLINSKEPAQPEWQDYIITATIICKHLKQNKRKQQANWVMTSLET